ncbi:MAG: hypothetical protein ACRENG_25080 [bacterium]
MRKILVLSLALTTFLALPLFAQEKEMAKEAMPMTPPKPLEDDFHKWMIGEWEGLTTSPMGKAQDWQKVEWGLDNQFVIVHYTSKWIEMNQESMKAMAEGTKMSKEDMDKMKNMVYKGMGLFTLHPMSGDFNGYWFDNWRGTYIGTGKREGNKVMATWEGPMGTRTETLEKVSDDKMVVTFTQKDPSGKVMEGKTELTRKKVAPKKT